MWYLKSNENQNLDNQIGGPDTQTKDDQQEIQTENNQEQGDQITINKKL